MTVWYEKPYRGGTPAKVKGFPRKLYPADVPKSLGRPPSKPGPDVIAYKRTISRLGRWPWVEFDDVYSNDFAHGANGRKSKVPHSGVAGVQRQQHMDATGHISLAMFNMLRSALVPKAPGFENPGERAMDAAAVRLINKAWDIYKGHEIPPGGEGTVRLEALKLASTQVGIKESPFGSNRQKYGTWYGMNGVPWCAIFATWCYENGAAAIKKNSPSFVRGSRYSFVPNLVGDARSGRNGLRTTDFPVPGDLVAFDWTYNGDYDHVGLFEKWLAGGYFNTVEGNTSGTNNSNGGQVMRRKRSRIGQRTVFIHVNEPK